MEFNKWYSLAIRSRSAPIKRTARMMKKYYTALKHTNHSFTNFTDRGHEDPAPQAPCARVRNRDNFRTTILFHYGGLDMCPR